MIILDNTLGCSYTLKIINLAGMLVRMEENISVREYILEKKGLKEGCYLIELSGPINYIGKIIVQ
jgi:hypothetical protein